MRGGAASGTVSATGVSSPGKPGPCGSPGFVVQKLSVERQSNKSMGTVFIVQMSEKVEKLSHLQEIRNAQAALQKVLEDYKNKHKMIMLIGALSSGCVSLFRIIFNNGIGFLIENLFQDLPGQWASSKRCML